MACCLHFQVSSIVCCFPSQYATTIMFLFLICHLHTGCAYYEFECPDGYCIPEFYVCDGYPDCVDGTDEDNCTFGEDFFHCLATLHDVYCNALPHSMLLQ